MSKIILSIIIILSTNKIIIAQSDSSFLNISAIVTLDSFVVTATRQGFNVNDFIELMRTDKSFYKAFKNLRFVSHEFENDLKMFNKKGKTKASYAGINQQFSTGNCRTMKVLEKEIKGNYFKRKRKHRYYTAQLMEHLFFTNGKVCESRNEENWENHGGGMEKHINELKKLIFSPGDKADVPLIGKKTAIFEKEMMPFYDYSIQSKAYNNEIDCYVFSVKLKSEFEEKKEGKTVIKFLETYFEKETFQVIARKYSLSHKTMVYDFDVTMNIKLGKFQDQYIPELIEYDGRWDIPAKAPEISKFELRFYNFTE